MWASHAYVRDEPGGPGTTRVGLNRLYLQQKMGQTFNNAALEIRHITPTPHVGFVCEASSVQVYSDIADGSLILEALQ